MASPKAKPKKQRSSQLYPYEMRLRAVKLHLDEGYSRMMLDNSTIKMLKRMVYAIKKQKVVR